MSFSKIDLTTTSLLRLQFTKQKKKQWSNSKKKKTKREDVSRGIITLRRSRDPIRRTDTRTFDHASSPVIKEERRLVANENSSCDLTRHHICQKGDDGGWKTETWHTIANRHARTMKLESPPNFTSKHAKSVVKEMSRHSLKLLECYDEILVHKTELSRTN